MKKAQAAMEFLMTYGWAILVVIAAIAALAYFGVLSPANLLPQRCVGESGMDCLRKPIYDATTNNVQFVIKNNQGFNIVVTDMAISGTSGCGTVQWYNFTIDDSTTYVNATAAVPTTVQLDNGKTGALMVGCGLDFATGRQSDDFVMSYYDTEAGQGFVQKVTYSLKGNAR
jgi:hypothetical protein